MKRLRWAAFAWAALGCLLELPLADAQAGAAAACPAAGNGADGESASTCAPPPAPPSPLDVLLVGGGILGSIVADLAPAHLRGRYAGLSGFAWSVASVLAPLAGGALLAIGPEALWFTVGGIGLVSAVAMLALGPAIRRRSTPA